MPKKYTDGYNLQTDHQLLLQVLKKGRELIEKGWTRRASARDKWGHDVLCDSPRAVRFCALGALWSQNLKFTIQNEAKTLLENAAGERNMAAFNDDPGTSKKDVLAVYDRAIKEFEDALPH